MKAFPPNSTGALQVFVFSWTVMIEWVCLIIIFTIISIYMQCSIRQSGIHAGVKYVWVSR